MDETKNRLQKLESDFKLTEKHLESSKLVREIEEIKTTLKNKEERLKEIKPTSRFNVGWVMGAFDAYETCLNIIDKLSGGKMKSKFVFIKLEDGKVDLTQEELEKILEQVYQEGFNDGMNSAPTITTPSAPWPQPKPTPIPAPYIGDTPETIKPWFACLLGDINETTNKK